MKTKIVLISLGFEKPEMVETFEGTEEELRARLWTLQEGYCEDEKPKLRYVPIKEKSRLLLEAVSDSDYSHVAIVK